MQTCIIDLGPKGGTRGGEIVVAGTPDDVAAHEGSWTGKYLAPMLRRGNEAAAE